MHKLSDLQGVNERAVGYVKFEFEVHIDVPADEEENTYHRLMALISRQLSEADRLMPEGTSFQDSELRFENVDVTYEDDYDRAQDFNPNL